MRAPRSDQPLRVGRLPCIFLHIFNQQIEVLAERFHEGHRFIGEEAWPVVIQIERETTRAASLQLGCIRW